MFWDVPECSMFWVYPRPSVTTTRQITLHIICMNFQAVFFENNFQEFATLNAVCEEIIKRHIFIESRQE